MLITKASLCKIRHVVVLGSGSMGTGIAQVTAQSGIDVSLVDVKEEALARARRNIEDSSKRIAKKLKEDERESFVGRLFEKLTTTTNPEPCLAKADLVVEAVVEDVKIKKDLFERVDKMARSGAILASNTSSLSIADLASVTTRRDRFAGLHFFNPVPVMKLVEVVRTADTSDDTVQRLLAYGKEIGKTTIACGDTPGFIVNRLLISVLAEGVRMMERGDAEPRDIDAAMRLGAGFPMGPIELCDYVGVDVVNNVLNIWHQRFPDDPLFRPSPTMQRLTAEGKLGTKTGEGFYLYKK